MIKVQSFSQGSDRIDLMKGLIHDGKRYSKEERTQAVKLAQETSAKTAWERLGVNLNTLNT